MKYCDYIYYNNECIHTSDFPFSFENRAFLYGDMCFETIRIVDGMPCFVSLHKKRLQKALQTLQLDYSLENLEKKILELMYVNELFEGGSIKIMIYRKDGLSYCPNTLEANGIIMLKKDTNNFYEINPKGLTIDFFSGIKKTYSPISFFKNSHNSAYIQASIFAKKKSLDDVIILNDKERICETTNSNIFIIKNRTAYTPSIKEGCIDGVMRKIVCSLLERKNIPVKKTSITKDWLLDADEIFLTNVVRGIQWVGSFQKKRFSNATAKFILEKINEKMYQEIALV